MSKSQDVSCLFCGEVPCVCEGKTSKKKAPRKNAFPKAVTPTKDLGAHDSRGGGEAEEVDPFEAASIPEVRPRFKPKAAMEQERDLSTEAAFRSLLPILGSTDRVRVQDALEGAAARKRSRILKAVREWRKRNEK